MTNIKKELGKRPSGVFNFIECLRDMADRDYISARMNYRLGLLEQFLWAALQAIEKYLKGILLYNDKKIEDIYHDIVKAYDRVLSIDDIDFDFPKGIRDFIAYLNRFGNNRYLEIPFYTTGNELLYLDKTVWNLRRYCKNLRVKIKDKNNQEKDLFELEIQMVKHSFYKKFPNRFQINGGFLERVLDCKFTIEARDALVWKNFYYGKIRKKIIKNFTKHMYSAVPTHYRHPDVYKALKGKVLFPKKVKSDLDQTV